MGACAIQNQKRFHGDFEVAEVMSQLEKIAYLAAQADTVKERRELDELLRQTQTEIDAVSHTVVLV